jgi:hypothetical protein
MSSPNQDLTRLLKQLLIEDESIIYQGMVKKKKFFNQKVRLMVATNRPRLFYVDIEKQVIKSIVNLSSDMELIRVTQVHFFLQVPGKRYNLTTDSNDVNLWEAAIRSLAIMAKTKKL